jgi:Flp pilus assembly protein TadD
MRGYAATGQQKKALEEARLALAQAPDDANRKNLEGVVARLEKGEKID